MRKSVEIYLNKVITKEIEKLVRNNASEKVIKIDGNSVNIRPDYLYHVISEKPMYKLLKITEKEFFEALEDNKECDFLMYTTLQLLK